MSRPLGRLAAILLATVLAGCATPPPSIAPSGSAGPCPILIAPGPADEPPRAGGDLVDTADLGPGRWALCLSAPAPLTLEGSAWCLWDEARSAVVEVTGLPTPAGTVAWDAWLSFAGGALEIHLTDEGSAQGLIANYAPRSELPPAVPASAPEGIASVDLELKLGAEDDRPPGAPAAIGGVLRWACGEPPP